MRRGKKYMMLRNIGYHIVEAEGCFLLSLGMVRLDRKVDWDLQDRQVLAQRRRTFHSDHLFLARLLDALLAGVQRALLALGRLLHVLLGLGV